MANINNLYSESVVISGTATASPVFIPMTPWLTTTEVKKVRSALEMRGNPSTGCEINAAYQCTQDMVTLSSSGATSIISGGNWLSSDGFQPPNQTDGFTDISATTKGYNYVRFGLQVRPASGGDGYAKGCWASIRIDIQE